MNNERLIMIFLANMFMEIREEINEGRLDVAFAISDFSHNIPFHIGRVMEESGNCDGVVEYIRERAKIKKMSRWCDNLLKNSGINFSN